MSIGIIVRPSGYSRKKGAPVFRPHFNRELVSKDKPHGQMFYTKEQYYGELKKRGLAPYDPNAKDCGKTKPVVMSEDTKGTIREINAQTYKGKFQPSGRLLDKMASKGVKIKPTDDDLKKLPGVYSQGGISDDKRKH